MMGSEVMGREVKGEGKEAAAELIALLILLLINGILSLYTNVYYHH